GFQTGRHLKMAVYQPWRQRQFDAHPRSMQLFGKAQRIAHQDIEAGGMQVDTRKPLQITATRERISVQVRPRAEVVAPEGLHARQGETEPPIPELAVAGGVEIGIVAAIEKCRARDAGHALE